MTINESFAGIHMLVHASMQFQDMRHRSWFCSYSSRDISYTDDKAVEVQGVGF